MCIVIVVVFYLVAVCSVGGTLGGLLEWSFVCK